MSYKAEFLRKRGIPFKEVRSNQDMQAVAWLGTHLAGGTLEPKLLDHS